MKNIETLKSRPSQFISMTSLTIKEFELLHDSFDERCRDYFMRYTLRGNLRERIKYTEASNSSLQGSETKLFFLLSYLKNYPLQQFHASYFGISQSKVSELVKVLYPLLAKTLQSMGLTPSRNSEELKSELIKYKVNEANMDATEREVNRSSDYEVQKEFYSGKKKAHDKEQLIE